MKTTFFPALMAATVIVSGGIFVSCANKDDIPEPIPARATAKATSRTLLWDGAASGGTSVFKQIQFQDAAGNYGSTNGSSVTAVTDATEGTVWKIHKDDLDRRCEALGAAGVVPSVGQTYFVGFKFKLPQTPAAGQTGSVFTMMQWKTAGTPNTQNYPFLLVYNSGRVKLEFYPDLTSTTLLYTHSVVANTWYSIVLKVTVGNTASTGNIQVYWGDDATAETLETGSTRFTGKTFDGTSIDPKWGYYRDTGADGDIYFSRLKIGSTYNDVKPY